MPDTDASRYQLGPSTRTTLAVVIGVGAVIWVAAQTYGAQMSRLQMIERDVSEMRAEVRDSRAEIREVRTLLLNEFRATRDERDKP
jgi:hypothetical protein